MKQVIDFVQRQPAAPVEHRMQQGMTVQEITCNKISQLGSPNGGRFRLIYSKYVRRISGICILEKCPLKRGPFNRGFTLFVSLLDFL